MEVVKDYGKLVKLFLMPTLIDGMHRGLRETHKNNSPEGANEELPKVNYHS